MQKTNLFVTRPRIPKLKLDALHVNWKEKLYMYLKNGVSGNLYNS